jgi:hypothetical protein
VAVSNTSILTGRYDHYVLQQGISVFPAPYFAFFIQNPRLSTRGILVFISVFTQSRKLYNTAVTSTTAVNWRYSTQKQYDIIGELTAIFQ